MENENQEIIVNVNVTELNEIVTEIQGTVDGIEGLCGQIVPNMQRTVDTLASINTCLVMMCTIMLGVFIYDYCKRIFKKKSIK